MLRCWDYSAKQAGTLSGMLSGMRVVKAFAQEPREFERFERSSDTLRRSRIKLDRSNASFSAIMGLVFSLGGLIVWYVGGREVLADEMTLGALMAYFAYLSMFYEPLSTLSEFTTWLTSVMTGCQRIFELLDAPAETIEPANPRSLSQPRGEIRFENVTFGYERHRPVLQEVGFTIRPGERIGIVGRSGSGKSTLVNLISRFYDVDTGRVLIDGVNIRELATSELRRHVGVVLQEPFLFRGTIADNLVYGQPAGGAEEAISAARAAQAHDFVLRKPLAYDTWLGERGAGLSGGEKQRVSIARALLYDPKILILDEATSSIDTESEKEIQEALRVLTRGRTTLALAHRLSTLRDSDRIFVIDKGRLIEQGTHHELMQSDGNYARLVKIQTQIARNMNIQATLDAAPNVVVDEPNCQPAPDESRSMDVAPRWLTPGAATLRAGAHGSLEVKLPDGALHRGVCAISCFPATRPNDFICLHASDRDGQEHEVGILRELDEWPPDIQQLVRDTRGRSYFVRRIIGIDDVKLENHYLMFRVRTDQGQAEFSMHWNDDGAQAFGERGKILVDLEDNRFFVPDVEDLPARDRALLERFVY
jgi:ATP-binding cassette, subfamily B, bacterial